MKDIKSTIEKFNVKEVEINKTIEDLKRELFEINNNKTLSVIKYIKEWFISNEKALQKDNVRCTFNNNVIEVIGFADSDKDINSFKIKIYIHDNNICLTGENRDARYWEKSCYIYKIFSYKQSNDLILYLKKNLPVRINYRKQRVENELYKKFKLKNVW